MAKEFQQIQWDAIVEDDCRQLVRLAIREDLDRQHDWTTLSLIAEERQGAATVAARTPGVICGLAAAQLAIGEINVPLQWRPLAVDGQTVNAGQAVAEVRGPARDLLTAERLLLNLIGRLSGVASLTRMYVDAVAGQQARIYDTRKTTPGWRRLEKFAVRCGGGVNHRSGLFDAVLIKDNHLAAGADGLPWSPPQAVRQARQFLRQALPERHQRIIVEIEVDTLEQLREVLPAEPDIVLLDNMSTEQLRQAVQLRNQASSSSELEASGGVNLHTVADIAASGVERISVGALTHSAVSLDVGLDWIR